MNTMGQILRHWRVLTAAAFSVVIIVGAYVLVRGVGSPPLAEASAETALLQAIATKDSDGDGLPDWEEALYGADPRITDTFHLGMTDGEAVSRGLVVPKAIADINIGDASPSASASVDGSLPPPPAEGSLTAAFAEHFFALYLTAKEKNGGADLSQADMQTIADETVRALSDTLAAAPDFKSAKDLTVSGSGTDALQTFAIQAEAVLLKNTSTASASEIAYLTDVVQNNHEESLTPIISIAKAYRDSAVGLSVLPAPRELASAHLALVNALMRVSEICSDFARVNTDPLATMLALEQYPQAVLALGTAFIDIGKVYKTANISLPADASGAAFVNLMTDIANEQAAAKKP